MAGVAAAAAATSTLILTSPPSSTPLSSLSLPPSPFPGLCSSTLPRFHHTNPSLTICHAKFSGSIREEGEGIFGSSFGDEIMAEEEYESDDDDEDDDTESSIDLLIRFVRSIFKKVSKRARKATSSILPDIISPQLVSFAVDGVLILASLSILKAFLEVICTLGGTVFVVILLLRVLWSAVDYFQSSSTGFNQSGASYGKSQPVT
ncbi:PREDICTED: uncharacterized protein LOC109161175 [Ipomoea nil]|uniref:uncharacterized protein LOC109161175 n=1 Tax=Ipomoea nil TaxID=35883 RepID=UPI0009019AE4|nr:PREDICTED: uncharacterized protein LOC109161175 [Ipomoea nil]XP_019165079.1 PREDICTED: uncharacterized protein LOC109161175 [Ipomoea nil]